MFSEQKLNKIKSGFMMKNRLIKYHCDIISKQTTNTWIHLKSNDNSIINIKHAFRKFSLRVCRVIRVGFGPFSLTTANLPGTINEVSIPRTVGNYLYEDKKEKMNNKLEKLDNTRIKVKHNNEKFEDNVIKLFENKKNLMLNEDSVVDKDEKNNKNKITKI
jgi:hypothetical protein